jgi:hypothetical protein
MSGDERGNGYDGKQIERFLAQIDELDDELLSLRGQYMAACRGPRGRIKDVLAQVRESDINMVAFREMLHAHRDDRKRQARLADLEADDRDAYDLLIDALGTFGETPLGQAALARAKPGEDGGEALDDLTR